MKKIYPLIFVFGFLFLASFPISAQKQLSGELQMIGPQNSTEFGSVKAYSDGNGVWLTWQMKSEQDNLGFNVYRVSAGKSEIANANFIGGGYMTFGGETVVGQTYSFFDPKGSEGAGYVVETLAVDGRKMTSERVFASFVESLTNVAGRTSAEFINDSKKAEYRIEKSQALITKEEHLEIAENELPPNLITQRFISSLPGVKLGTKREGVYRVSRAELQTAGFDVNLPDENWQLFMNGNEQSIIVGSGGTYIEFLGKGIDTIESGTQIYYLINGSRAGKRINNSVRRSMAGTVIANSYDHSFYRADRIQYVSQIRNGDASNFFGNVINTSGTNVSVSLDGIDPGAGPATLTVAVQGLTLTPHNVNVIFNGVTLLPLSGTNYDMMTRSYQIPTSSLIEGVNTVTFRIPSSLSDICLVGSIKVDYARTFKAQQNSLSFVAKQNKEFEVREFSSNQIRVFDTTFPDSPSLITNLKHTTANGMFGRTIPSNRPRRMFATTDEAVRAIDSIELNTPSALATNNHAANLVIISYKNWLTEAQVWANYRINDGQSVEVVRVDDIFDEFNYGITSANSIRSFLQFASSNWNTPPAYVLILGDASYDPRGYAQAAFENFVPTKMFDTLYEETGSDEALADFNDDGLSELAIGRIPVKTGGEVTNALNRAVIYEQTRAQVFSRGALFASDLPEGYDFAAMNQRLANELPTGMNKVMINRGDPNAKASLLADLNNGRFLVNYSGHGAPRLWAATDFYSHLDVNGMTNGTNYSIFTMLTCLNGYYVSPFSDSLGEQMLKVPNGGAVAAWASSGKTTPDVQEVLARRFYRKISDGSIIRLGDLVRDAKQNVSGGRDVRLSWVLLGDPTLKVR